MVKTYETKYKGCPIRTWVDEAREIVVWVDKPNFLGIGLPKLAICEAGFDNHTQAVKFAKSEIDAGNWKKIMRLYRRD